MQLFFHPEISKEDSQITFPKEESRHIVKVLRKNNGDTLHVTNGSGNLFVTEITNASPTRCMAKVIEVKAEPAPSYYLHMAVAPTKMNERYEWFLEKATEIGVQEITPVICDHSERKFVKNNRGQRVLQSAMKQALQLSIPKLNEEMNLKDFIAVQHPGKKYIAHCEAHKERTSLKSILSKGETSVILIGPEGDFSPAEIDSAMEHGWIPVSLGNNRLRTETAAIMACATAALINEE